MLENMIAVDKIKPNPNQPRKYFDPLELQNLAQSIKEVGVIQSISVVEDGQGGYFILDGERRWRASQLAGNHEIPATVKDSTSEIGLLALIANIQRSDLNPIEEAHGFADLIENGYSKLKISQKCGVSLPRINTRLKLLEFDENIQNLFARKLLPINDRATEALLSIKDTQKMVKLAQKLARPGIKIQSIEIACQKLNAADKAVPTGASNPALQFSARKSGAINLPEWDILYQLNKVPRWPIVVDAAMEICDHCALRSQASSITCSDCPAVQLLAAMIDKSEKAHAK